MSVSRGTLRGGALQEDAAATSDPLLLPLEIHPFHMKRDPSASQWVFEESQLWQLVFLMKRGDQPSVRTVLRYAGHPQDIAR